MNVLVLFLTSLLLKLGPVQKPAKLIISEGKSREIRLGQKEEKKNWQSVLSDSSVVSIRSLYQKPLRLDLIGERIYTVTGVKKGSTLWILTDHSVKPARVVQYLLVVR